MPLSSKLCLQVALIAKLGDDVTISIAGKNLKTSKNIWMAEFFQYVYFGKKKLLEFLRLEGIQLYDLNGYNLI